MRVTWRHAALIGAILVLAGLNLRHWLPRTWPERASREAGSTDEFSADDFGLRAMPAAETMSMKRDLFRTAVKPAPRPGAAKVSPSVPVHVPQKTPEEVEHEHAQLELSQVRCVGAAFHKQRAEAFLVVNGQNVIVRVGEKAGGRFVVEAITRESVLLRDPVTQVAGAIAITGQETSTDINKAAGP